MNTLSKVFALVLGTSLLGASGCCGNGVCWHRVGPGLIHWQNQPSIACAPISSHPTHYPTQWAPWHDGHCLLPPDNIEAAPIPLPHLPLGDFEELLPEPAPADAPQPLDLDEQLK